MSQPSSGQSNDRDERTPRNQFPPPAVGTGAGSQSQWQAQVAPAYPQSGYQQSGYPPSGYPQPAYPQPGYAQAAYSGQRGGMPPMPSAYWPLSIVAVLLSLIFGVLALVYSSQVQPKYQAGDFAGAVAASNNARMWGIVGCVVGVVLIIALSSY